MLLEGYSWKLWKPEGLTSGAESDRPPYFSISGISKAVHWAPVPDGGQYHTIGNIGKPSDWVAQRSVCSEAKNRPSYRMVPRVASLHLLDDPSLAQLASAVR